MREGSKFKGSKQDLDNLIREVLPKFIANDDWLDSIESQVPEPEFTNICEAIAEAINRGYIENKINIHYMANGTIKFSHAHMFYEDSNSYTLSKSGKCFLGL